MNPAALRQALIETVGRIPDERVAIYLSGGYDSWSLVFAALAAGKKVAGYVFHIEGRESTDLRYARAGAGLYGLYLTEIPLWATARRLVEDIEWMKRQLGVSMKTEIECVWPFYRSIPFVREEYVLVGHEDMYCMTKRAAMHFRDRLDEYRVEARAHSGKQNEALGAVAERHGRTLVMPYEADVVRAAFAGQNWDDLHKPGVKQPTVDAFPDDFARIKVIRQGLQVGDSGIRDLFATLLESPYNVTRAKSVTAIYNRI